MPAAEQVRGAGGSLGLVVAAPPTRQSEARCLLVCHGLPLTRGGGRTAAGTLPELADHLAAESGWVVASCSLSGVGDSTGTFSGPRWREDLAAWAGTPERFHATVTASGAVDRASPLEHPETLMKGVEGFDPLAAIARIPPRRLLVVHGADDAMVPVDAARQLVAAAHGPAELRIIQGAGHWLRSDPRMVATLIGWLDRIR